MEIRRKSADILQILKKERGRSITEFSDELEISRSALQDCLSGRVNPSTAAAEHTAVSPGVGENILPKMISLWDRDDGVGKTG